METTTIKTFKLNFWDWNVSSACRGPKTVPYSLKFAATHYEAHTRQLSRPQVTQDQLISTSQTMLVRSVTQEFVEI